MPNNEPSHIITALVEAELMAERWERNRYIPKGNVVTVAHELGSGGRAIARQLARRLGIEYYDQQILDAIVAIAPAHRAAMERLDQQVVRMRDEVMHQIVTGTSAFDEYRRHLVSVLLNIARKSGVVVGREAHLILAGYKAFRVYIVGSVDICTGRLARQERVDRNGHLSLEEARQRVLRVREDRKTYIGQLFNRDGDDVSSYDLVINTDHIPVETASDIVLYAMQQAGFEIPQTAVSERMRQAAA
jgi:cytidylate kinase